jgi:hypothetical protein
MDSQIDATKMPGYHPEWAYGYTPEETVTALVLDEDDTFSQVDAPAVLLDYVCPICHGQLSEYFVPMDRRVIVACTEHGNVCTIGRIMRSSVSIEMERAARRYPDAIRNLPDLWGELIPPPQTREKILSDLGF